MQQFILPTFGGLLIGLASVLLLAALGRIAGISGILWSAFSGESDSAWRWLFAVGLLLGAASFHLLSGRPAPVSELSTGYAVAGGLLVGIGVKLGSGCTSGHGVCGIGRLSPRSIVATLTFMLLGFVTVFLMRHGL